MTEMKRGPKTEEYKCKNCKKPFVAGTADRDRGWARFCSKSCKAIKQEKRTGQMADYLMRRSSPRSFNDDYSGVEDDTHPFSSDALGQW